MRELTEALGTVAAEVRDCLTRIRGGELERAMEVILAARRVFVAGAGRTGYVMRAFAMRLMHAGKTAHVVGDATAPAVSAGDLLVVGSGSGRTSSLVEAARKARELGVRILLLTIDPDSPIAGLADVVVTIPAPSPKLARPAAVPAASVQPMGSLFEQSLYLALDALVLVIVERLGVSFEAMFERHANLE